MKPEYSCALGNFQIEGMESDQVALKLWNEHQIHVTSVKWENITGIRVTPHVYTSAKDLDRFVEAVMKVAAS